MKCFPDHNDTVTRNALPTINSYFNGFKIFDRFYVKWEKVPYFRSETSKAFRIVNKLINYGNI